VDAALEKNRAEVEALCRRYGVRRLELFGSAAEGAARLGGSDLDFLVDFGPRSTPGYADAYFGLLESLESLFGGPVDLVDASAIRNPYFLQAIERSKTLLYVA